MVVTAEIQNPEQKEKSLTQQLFDEFIKKSFESQADWIRDFTTEVLESTLHEHARRLRHAVHLYSNLSTNISSEEQLEYVSQRLQNIAHQSALVRINKQIKALKEDQSPETLEILIKENSLRAWELKSEVGSREGRTDLMNRTVLAGFIKFLSEKGYKKIGIIAGDMDGLKAYNKITPQLGDCGLLTVFYAAEKVITNNGGVIFIPNQQGGDDILGVFVDKDESELEQIASQFNPTIEQAVPNIRAYTKRTILGQPLKFTSGESKKLSMRQVREIEKAHKNRFIKGPRITSASRVIIIPKQNPIRGFFNKFDTLHKTVDDEKTRTSSAKRGSLKTFIGGKIPQEFV